MFALGLVESAVAFFGLLIISSTISINDFSLTFLGYLKSLPKSIISIISAQRYHRYNFPNPSTQSPQNLPFPLQNSKIPHFSPHIFAHLIFFSYLCSRFPFAHTYAYTPHIRTHETHNAHNNPTSRPNSATTNNAQPIKRKNNGRE